jgi:hypothetical protein
MLRSLIRSGVLAAVVGAALAFSGSALANPTTPQLSPIPPTVFAGPLTVSWSPSAFDPNLIYAGYVLTVTDIPGAPFMPFATDHSVPAPFTSKTINVTAGHKYILKLRAMEVTNQFEVKLSGSDYEVFEAVKQFKIPDFYEEYIEWPPRPPWCLTCPPFELFFGDDPLELRARVIFGEPRVYERQLAGVYVDGRGEVSEIYAR